MIEGFCTNTGKDVFIHALCNSVGGYVHQNDVKNIGQFEQGNWPHLDWNKWTDKPCAIVGTLRGTERIIWECQKRNHPFYYMDHAYFGATRDYKSKGPNGVLYRLIRSQMQLNYIIELEKEDRDRIKKFGKINWKPFTKDGEHILLCPPTKAICRLYHLGDEQLWIDTQLTELQKYTDRNIIVRKKDTKIPLQKQLQNCHAVVTHQSTAAIEAILNGVPSFCDEVSAANEVSESLYENIESPHYPDDDLIKQWTDSLLAVQFTGDEFKNGTAYHTATRLQT